MLHLPSSFQTKVDWIFFSGTVFQFGGKTLIFSWDRRYGVCNQVGRQNLQPSTNMLIPIFFFSCFPLERVRLYFCATRSHSASPPSGNPIFILHFNGALLNGMESATALLYCTTKLDFEKQMLSSFRLHIFHVNKKKICILMSWHENFGNFVLVVKAIFGNS